MHRARTVVVVAALVTAVPAAAAGHGPVTADVHDVGAPASDITATPDGRILVTSGTSVLAVGEGGVDEVATVPVAVTDPPTTATGIDAVGAGAAYVATGGGDLAAGAGLWRVTPGGARLIGDVEAFEVARDPDAAVWKDPACEEVDPFTAGPQSNPYKLTAVPGGALVADAAGNSLLAVRADGRVELVAVFTPPLDAVGGYQVLFELPDGTPCYVQPVPTSVAIGPDGATYVGELTGAPAQPGESRIWRIDAGARDVTCPSDACRVVVDGLTSVVDLVPGPDGSLYVVELDAAGWLSLFVGGSLGGTVQRCDVTTGGCELVVSGLTVPGAVTVDRHGDLWLLEDSLGAAVVRRLEVAS